MCQKKLSWGDIIFNTKRAFKTKDKDRENY